jgi:hypothetical protein
MGSLIGALLLHFFDVWSGKGGISRGESLHFLGSSFPTNLSLSSISFFSTYSYIVHVSIISSRYFFSF